MCYLIDRPSEQGHLNYSPSGEGEETGSVLNQTHDADTTLNSAFTVVNIKLRLDVLFFFTNVEIFKNWNVVWLIGQFAR